MNVLQYPSASGSSNPALVRFLTTYASLQHRRVLELGTKRSNPNVPTHHRAMLEEWAPLDSYVMSDVEPGDDVDVVANAHSLIGPFGKRAFDAVLACSVWEHLERPWVAAEEVMRVLAPGGVFFIQTHQSFPIHGYPNDYFRFSDAALRLLFEDVGACDVVTCYEFQATLTPKDPAVVWNAAAPAWLNVCAFGRRP